MANSFTSQVAFKPFPPNELTILKDCPIKLASFNYLIKLEKIDHKPCFVIEALAQTLEKNERKGLQQLSLCTLLCS
jgi:hypothetical protein